MKVRGCCHGNRLFTDDRSMHSTLEQLTGSLPLTVELEIPQLSKFLFFFLKQQPAAFNSFFSSGCLNSLHCSSAKTMALCRFAGQGDNQLLHLFSNNREGVETQG